MMRRDFRPPAATRAVQAGGLLIVLAGLLTLFFHALTHPNAVVALGRAQPGATETAPSPMSAAFGAP